MVLMVAVKLYGYQRTLVRKRAAKLYVSGHSLREIAERVGYSTATVRTLLIEADVQLRPVGRHAKPVKKRGK